MERQDYRVAIRNGFGSMVYNLFKNAPKGSAMKRIFENNQYIVMQSEEEMLQTIEDDSKTLVYHYAGKLDTEEIIEIDIIEAATLPQALAFKKGSEFSALFNYQTLKMIESGIIKRNQKNWAGDRNHEYGMAEPIVLGYDNLFFPFGWLALGIIVAMAILAVETFGASKRHLGIYLKRVINKKKIIILNLQRRLPRNHLF